MIDIDLVYLWVDGNDPKWIAKRDACIGKPSGTPENCEGRFVDNDELKYSFRSIEKYAPWIRKIFVVTDNQTPKWLDASNPKVRIVDHTEIMPAESLPCFNSTVIEHNLYKIPDLAEHFIFANDDMYINQPVTPDTFFAKDSLPIIRMHRRPLKKWIVLYKTKILGKTLENYNQKIHNAALLVEQKYGTYYNGRTHHNIDAYLRSSYQHVRELFDKEISPTMCNHKRSPKDIHRNLYSYVALAEKRAHLCYVSEHKSLRFRIHKKELYEKFEKYNPVFFCMNDSQFANDDDRKRAIEFLQKLFPEKSQFEK